MLRVISRPITVPAERIALLNAALAIIFSSMPGSAVSRDFTSPSALGKPGCSTGGGNGALSGGGANRALSRSYADSRSTVWPYSACRRAGLGRGGDRVRADGVHQ
jgi:hypothetical protein